MKKWERTVIQGGLLLAGLLLIGFGYQSGGGQSIDTAVEPDTTGTEETLYYSDITYQLEWESTDGAWQGQVNDLGYTIWLDEGYLVSATIELVPCLQDDGAEEVVSWFPQTAYAGHGTDGADESRLVLVRVEALHDPDPLITAGEISVSDEIYCQAHYLVSPALVDAVGADVDMAGQTIRLTGRYQAPESTTETLFVIETDMAWGALVDLESVAADQVTLQTGYAPTTIAIERDMNHLFTGLDFEQMTAQEQGMSVLRELINSVAVRVD